MAQGHAVCQMTVVHPVLRGSPPAPGPTQGQNPLSRRHTAGGAIKKKLKVSNTPYLTKSLH